MSRRYFHLPERAEEALDIFRSRWAGKWPRTSPDWALLDAHKAEVMQAVFGPAEHKRMETDRGYRAEYRDYIRELVEGEPGARIVDPVGVPGDVAAIGQTDAAGYETQYNERSSNMGGSDE